MEKKQAKREKPPQDYIGIQDIADKLGVSWNFVRDRIVPEVPHVQIHNRILIRKDAFESYMKKLECGA